MPCLQVQAAQFRKIFKLYDKDRSGSCDKGELGAILTTMGVEKTADEIATLSEGPSSLTPPWT